MSCKHCKKAREALLRAATGVKKLIVPSEEKKRTATTGKTGKPAQKGKSTKKENPDG